MDDKKEKKVLLGSGSGEITEKKSRFIANCFEVHSEEEALGIIEKLKKQYWDARHNCFAYVLGETGGIQRFSDDKEPQGTAGKPILDVLLANGLYNTLIVVTRYFGGILLGAGGLVRAYSSAASQGLKNCTISRVYYGTLCTASCDYNTFGKLQYAVGQLSEHCVALITETEYSENVTLTILTEAGQTGILENKVTELSAGKSRIENKRSVVFALKDGQPVYIG